MWLTAISIRLDTSVKGRFQVGRFTAVLSFVH